MVIMEGMEAVGDTEVDGEMEVDGAMEVDGEVKILERFEKKMLKLNAKIRPVSFQVIRVMVIQVIFVGSI